jgi:hypothetical protein
MNDQGGIAGSTQGINAAWTPRWRADGASGVWLYGDDPTPSNDLLDRQRLANQLARAISEVANQSPSAVVALVGPWGSGKTTLLDQIQTSLASDARWCTARFNPWAYSTYEQSVSGFFEELSGALPEGILGDTPRERIGKWVSRLAPLGALGNLVNVNAAPLMEGAAALISGGQSPEDMRERAAESLATLSRPILVVLDDLDRLQPVELLLTFKLVRLLGRLPNVYYLLAYDESTLEDTLERTDLIGTAPGRARQYLEKMVQVRLEIPPMLDRQKISLMNMGLDDICDRRNIGLDADIESRIQMGWSECLSRYMDQPRAIKLLFTQLDALWPEVEGEVEFSDFLHLTFLRRFEPKVFDLLIANRSELLGEAIAWPGRGQETNAAKWARWQDMVTKCGAKHPENIAALLAEMFMVVRGARDNMTYSSHYRQDARRRFGIDCTEFFDRYVQLGVPQGDVSQAALVAAIEELRVGSVAGRENIRDWLLREPETMVKRLQDLVTGGPLNLQVLLILGEVYERVSAIKSMFGASGYSVRALGRDLLAGCDAADLSTWLTQLASSGESGLTLAADLLRTEGTEGRPTEELLKARIEVSKELTRRVRDAGSKPLDEGSRIVRDAWSLRAISDQGAVRTLLWEVIRSTSMWTITDLLGLLVPTGTASDGRRSWDSLGELEVGHVDDLLGLDEVLDNLPSSLPEPTEQVEYDRRQAAVTMEERKKYALTVMARERASREQLESSGEAGPVSHTDETGADTRPGVGSTDE